jgi:hypothetical protein
MFLSWWQRRIAQSPRNNRRPGPVQRLHRQVPKVEALEERALLSLNFASAVNYDVGSHPGSIALGDFNGDGKLDMAVANILGGNVSILLANGDGTFQNAVNYSAGSEPRAVVAGDFRGNGILDLAVADHTGRGTAGQVSILLGNGNGTFQSAVTYDVGTGPDAIAVGDFFGDGHLSLAVVNDSPNNSVGILRGNGDATFRSQVTYPVGSGPTSIVVGDFNGDGHPDLAVSNRSNNNVSVLLNNGDGTFAPRVNYNAGSGAFYVTAADLNHDGYLDLVVANRNGNNVSVLLGNSNGTFRSAVNYSVGTKPWAVTVADFDGDGNPDLAVVNRDDSTVSVLTGNGDGTFHSRVNFDVASQPFFVAAADVDGDSAPDLLVANAASDSVSVLVNQPAATHLNFIAPTSVTAGQRFDVTVQALSAFNTPARSYRGTIHFVASNGAMANYTFTAADRGSHTFNIAVFRAGNLSVTGTDTQDASLTGGFSLVINPAAADHLAITGPDSAASGQSFDFTVTVLDAYNNVVVGYLGTITFMSSDSAPLLPVPYTFTADDMGSHRFSPGATLFDVNPIATITAADNMDSTIQGTLTLSIQ